MEFQIPFLVLELYFILMTKSSDVIVSYRVHEVMMVSYGQHIGSHTARSILDCFLACSKLETCRSVMFSVTSLQCSLNRQSIAVNTLNSLPFNLPTPPIVKYGIKSTSCVTSMGYSCTSTTDCVDSDSMCNNGECTCNAGLSYNPDTCSCTPGCIRYGTTFQAVDNLYVVNTNMLRIIDTELSLCLQLCIEETSFVCRLMEHFIQENSSGECQIQDASFEDLVAVYEERATTYIRDCDFA